jgi:glycosyltransferase involved in cell wall biosynthesis
MNLPVKRKVPLSIITINYNNQKGLERTLRSVDIQSYKDYEYIIIDGGSTDSSNHIVSRYRELVSYYVSEPDNGIFHAMNKGVQASTGEYLLFLNSGDFLFDEKTLQAVIDYGLDEDIIYGNIKVTKSAVNEEEWCPPAELTFKTFLERSIPHQSSFIKRSLFTKVGFYNEHYKMVSDWEFFMVAVCRFQCSYKHFDRLIAVFDEDGITSNPENYPAMGLERQTVLDAHFSRFVKDYEKMREMEKELRKFTFLRNARVIYKDLVRKLKNRHS